MQIKPILSRLLEIDILGNKAEDRIDWIRATKSKTQKQAIQDANSQILKRNTQENWLKKTDKRNWLARISSQKNTLTTMTDSAGTKYSTNLAISNIGRFNRKTRQWGSQMVTGQYRR